MVVASGQAALPMMSSARTTAVYNSYVAPTSASAQNADLSFSTETMEGQIARRCLAGGAHALPASDAASRILGNTIGANLFLLGAAWQMGLIPLSLAALERAIDLNGIEVDMNKRAFALGRLAVADRGRLDALAGASDAEERPRGHDTLQDLVADRRQWLKDYQDDAYAQRYETLVREVMAAERNVAGSEGELSEMVARHYAKLLAYKDEYEVARLMTRSEFFADLEQTFKGDYRLGFNLAPPLLSRRDPTTGRYRKMEFGPWILHAFRLLAPLKVLRGTALDIFGFSRHRRMERKLIAEYEQTIGEILGRLQLENLPTAIQLASWPEHVRGYDVVKETSVEEVRAQREELLRQMQGLKVTVTGEIVDEQY